MTSKKISKKSSYLKKKHSLNIPSLIPHVISYNLSWATQDNIESGTERRFVKWCNKNKKKWKKRDYYKFPNWCTQSALDGLRQHIDKYPVEFILFQEPTFSNFKDSHIVLDYLNINQNNLDIVNGEQDDIFISILYNKKYYKKIISFSGDIEDGRPYLIVKFKDIIKNKNIIVASVHMPHNKFLNDNTQYLVNEMMTLKDKNTIRLIMGGDFNGVPTILPKQFNNINNDLLYLPKTCCWQGGRGYGDLIYDTNQEYNELKIIPEFDINGYIGFIKNGSYIPKDKYIGSDHLPVFLMPNISKKIKSYKKTKY